jgi:hypothetical protein
MNTISSANRAFKTGEHDKPVFYSGENVVLDAVDQQTLIYIHNKLVPSEADGAAVLELYRSMGAGLQGCVCLVLTDGGAPSRGQRDVAFREFGQPVREIRSAIVSDSATVRFAISTMTLVIKNIASFNVPYFDEALGFLNLSASGNGVVRTRLRTLAAAIEPGRFTTFDRVVDQSGLRAPRKA